MAQTPNRSLYAAALILLVGGAGWLVYSGLAQNSAYFLTVSEALTMDPAELGSARLFGTVEGKDLHPLTAMPGVQFTLQDKTEPSQAIRVEYRGAVPDTFKPGAEVIVEGGMSPEDKVFHASVLMTKCPSKYTQQSRGDAKN